MHQTKVKVAEDALDANTTIATANRADFDRAGVAVVNLMSAPGAGKTMLLERVLAERGDLRVGVLEGDVQGSIDADRLSALHVPVVQINTDSGFGGECHLDANMVRSALADLKLADLDLLVVENVGNLVCPAEFRIGEDAKVMICSVTEGEDKPLKYPVMFRKADLVIVTKTDLLPALPDFREDLLRENLARVMPEPRCIALSARSGEGMDAWLAWLDAVRETLAPDAAPGETLAADAAPAGELRSA
jgi:hydrogenase nickel incorporation protein HypB